MILTVKCLKKITELRSYIVEKQHEIAENADAKYGNKWPQEIQDEYNSIVPYVMEELTKLIGKPTQEGQFTTIMDNNSNTTQLKAIKSVTGNGGLGWFF